jgi:hypothetical protein
VEIIVVEELMADLGWATKRVRAHVGERKDRDMSLVETGF